LRLKFHPKTSSNAAWRTEKKNFARNSFFRYKKSLNVKICNKKKLQVKPWLTIFHKWKVKKLRLSFSSLFFENFKFLLIFFKFSRFLKNNIENSIENNEYRVIILHHIFILKTSTHSSFSFNWNVVQLLKIKSKIFSH
jgi:hypothetical protein